MKRGEMYWATLAPRSGSERQRRRQVTAYIPFTRRFPLVEEFTPEQSEDRLYTLVSDYLRRDNLQALPASQRSLMTPAPSHAVPGKRYDVDSFDSISRVLHSTVKLG